MGTMEMKYLYCPSCREYPDTIKGVRKWGTCEYEQLCGKCGGKLEQVDY